MGRADVWRIEDDGRVDFRVERYQFQKMKDDLPECREEAGVEDLVRKMEMEQRNHEVPQGDWFESFVRMSACEFPPCIYTKTLL